MAPRRPAPTLKFGGAGGEHPPKAYMGCVRIYFPPTVSEVFFSVVCGPAVWVRRAFRRRFSSKILSIHVTPVGLPRCGCVWVCASEKRAGSVHNALFGADHRMNVVSASVVARPPDHLVIWPIGNAALAPMLCQACLKYSLRKVCCAMRKYWRLVRPPPPPVFSAHQHGCIEGCGCIGPAQGNSGLMQHH